MNIENIVRKPKLVKNYRSLVDAILQNCRHCIGKRTEDCIRCDINPYNDKNSRQGTSIAKIIWTKRGV